jgi:hypothetical protein
MNIRLMDRQKGVFTAPFHSSSKLKGEKPTCGAAADTATTKYFETFEKEEVLTSLNDYFSQKAFLRQYTSNLLDH